MNFKNCSITGKIKILQIGNNIENNYETVSYSRTMQQELNFKNCSITGKIKILQIGNSIEDNYETDSYTRTIQQKNELKKLQHNWYNQNSSNG